YSTWTTSAVTYNVGTGASSGTGGTASVTSVTGNSANAATNTITNGGTYVLTDATPNAGSIGGLSWTNFGKLNANTAVNFSASGSVTGVVTAPSLDYSTWTTSAVTYNVGTGASSGTGGTASVTSVTGNSANAATNTITNGGTYVLTDAT